MQERCDAVSSNLGILSRWFAPNRRRRRLLGSFVCFHRRVLSRFDRVFQIFFIRLALWAVHGQALQIRQKLLDPSLQRFHALANILLLFDSNAQSNSAASSMQPVYPLMSAFQAFGSFLVSRVHVCANSYWIFLSCPRRISLRRSRRCRGPARARLANLVCFRFRQIFFFLGRRAGRARGESRQKQAKN